MACNLLVRRASRLQTQLSSLRGVIAPAVVCSPSSNLNSHSAASYANIRPKKNAPKDEIKGWTTDFKLPPNYDGVEYPPERRKLKFVDKTPTPVPGVRIGKSMKQLIDMRGPELIHNKLIHKQYGIRALTGGSMKYGHFEMVRLNINRRMDDNHMFAVWRIDPPWKPVTKKGQGQRMGSGKGAISHYITPVRAGRIIVEMGGHCAYEEVYYILKIVANSLPFKAEIISQEILDEEAEEQKHIEENNINPFDFEYCLKRNMLGARKWASPYDYIWHGKYR